MKRSRWFAGLLVLLATLTGCGDDALGPDADPAGLYALETIDGLDLPHELEGVTIQSSDLDLRENCSFTLRTTFQERGRQPETEFGSGTYALNGERIRLIPSGVGGDSFDASYTGETIEIDDGDDVWVYRR